MNLIKYTKNILINDKQENIGNFLSQVSNLPKWTKFFLEVNHFEDNKYKAKTVIGESITWIEQDDNFNNLFICSKFGEKLEKAHIALTPMDQNRVTINFTLALPDKLSEDQITQQLSVMEQELKDLKTILEN